MCEDATCWAIREAPPEAGLFALHYKGKVADARASLLVLFPGTEINIYFVGCTFLTRYSRREERLMEYNRLYCRRGNRGRIGNHRRVQENTG
jgi:hypothetical protein